MCLRFFSRTISSSRSRRAPLTRTRRKPFLRRRSKRRWYSPFRPLTTGARTRTLAPAASAATRLRISSGVWDETTRPQLGQWGVADPGEEEAEEVVDLGRRSHGRAGVGRDGLLVDGDRRRDALDRLHLGLLHLVDELAGVGRETLDVAALALGEEGVEGEGRFPRAGRAGDDDELVPGQGDVDVLEIVLRRPLDAYLVQHNRSILAHSGFDPIFLFR